jgi:hypothetical protein
MGERPVVHRFPVNPEDAFVNAYLVETAAGVVTVDSLLTVSDSRAMRQALERLGKPLQAVLLTHSHPDQYAGLAQLVAEDELPIIAPQGVIDTIARDDALKDTIVGPMFGDEWPGTRIFPNTPIGDGENVTFDGVQFTVIDLGPSESPHDSPCHPRSRRKDGVPRRPDLRPQACGTGSAATSRRSSPPSATRSGPIRSMRRPPSSPGSRSTSRPTSSSS